MVAASENVVIGDISMNVHGFICDERIDQWLREWSRLFARQIKRGWDRRTETAVRFKHPSLNVSIVDKLGTTALNNRLSGGMAYGRTKHGAFNFVT